MEESPDDRFERLLEHTRSGLAGTTFASTGTDTSKPPPKILVDSYTNTNRNREQISAAKIFGNGSSDAFATAPTGFSPGATKTSESDTKKAARAAPSGSGSGSALSGASALASAATLGLGNIISSGITGISSYLQNSENLKFSKQKWEREWDASARLGLASPAQLGNPGLNGSFQGGRLTTYPKTLGHSPFSL